MNDNLGIPGQISGSEVDPRMAIELMAHELIGRAAAAGFNVEISPRPLQPLAMRNYELAVTIWPRQKP